MAAGAFTEFDSANPLTPQVTRVDHGRHGSDCVVTVAMTPPPTMAEVAVVRDGEGFLVLSAATGSLLASVRVDTPVRWAGLRAESASEGIRVRIPLRGPRPIRVAPRARPQSVWHRIRARMRRVASVVARLRRALG